MCDVADCAEEAFARRDRALQIDYTCMHQAAPTNNAGRGSAWRGKDFSGVEGRHRLRSRDFVRVGAGVCVPALRCSATAIAHDFGWTQPQIARAATLFLLLQTLIYPVCGWPLDRFGSRRFAMFSIAAFAVSLLVLGQIGNSLTQFYLAFALMGLVGAGTNVLSYAACNCALVQP